jgi:MFS family permease
VSDRYGRKIHYLSSISAQIPFLCAFLFSKSLTLSFFLYFFVGLCYVGRYWSTFVNIAEYSPEKYKNWLQSGLIVLDIVHQILVITYFKYVRDVFYLEIFGICLNILAIFGVYWIPESPVYLYNMFRFDECR